MGNESYLERPDRPDSILLKDGRRALYLGLFITLYFDKGYTLERQRAIASCFDDYWRLYGPDLCWAMNSTSPYWYNINRHQLAPPDAWLAKEVGGWEFKYHGGENVDSASSVLVQALGSSRKEEELGELSFIKAGIPLHPFEQQPEILLELTRKWCQKLCPAHGYGGIGLMLPASEFSWQEDYEATICDLAFKMLGAEIDYPLTHSRFLSKGIKGVNWLTVLSQEWLNATSGVEALKVITHELQLHNYGCGLIFQAGPKPVYSDGTDSKLALYRKLAKALKPIQVKEHDGVHSSGSSDTLTGPNFRKWLSRFD